MDFANDFTNYWLEGECLKGAPASQVPDECFDDACKISEAVGFVQKLGCAGRSQHVVSSEYHRCCLAVLRMAVEKYGETFPVLLRGTRSSRPDAEHQILFGTTDKTVAEFYGQVREYRNIKGLRTRSVALSVATDDYSQCDEEVIFFAD